MSVVVPVVVWVLKGPSGLNYQLNRNDDESKSMDFFSDSLLMIVSAGRRAQLAAGMLHLCDSSLY